MLPLVCLILAGESSLPVKPGWVETKSFSTPHATQAAAADGEFLYAVSNTHVAKLERRTGKPVSSATAPDVTHLNSAFVDGGKVYCAHSNYPTKPEAGDIRVYDPAANTLTLFHEFKNPPGSPVWCVKQPRGGPNWWCCFAHYGAADNGKTVLVEYTPEFKEVRRFTFPRAVVSDWDGMSASGGVWSGDGLLVSHHHYKVLYRLRVPGESGGELQFVEAVACPFPGQGIAADPGAPNGLVGIDRDKRVVVLATFRPKK